MEMLSNLPIASQPVITGPGLKLLVSIHQQANKDLSQPKGLNSVNKLPELERGLSAPTRNGACSILSLPYQGLNRTQLSCGWNPDPQTL